MINILGYHYEVRLDMTREELGAMGKCDLNGQRLYIANNMSEEAKLSTLLHEILEAIDMHMELNIKDHHIICGLEVGLFHTLRANGVGLTSLLNNIDTPMGERR